MSQLRFRRKEKKYTEVYNSIIFKEKSVELTGLYTTITALIDLAHNTKNTDKEFILSKKSLQSFCGYKDDKFKRIWNELKVKGYLKQYKIQGANGKFTYEYELLDEADITIHHSLIQSLDGSIKPNIPQSKIDSLINKPGVENTPLEPEGVLPGSGKKGDYYNTSSNKVCMYVCKANENFSLTSKNKEYIESIKEKISFDLFEQIVVDTKNKNKTFSYVVSTITKSMENNITTLDAFLENRKNYKPNKSKNDSNNKGSSTPVKKNRFHNFNQRIDKMKEEEVMDNLKASQEEKFGKSALLHGIDPRFTMYQNCINYGWDKVMPVTLKNGLAYAKENGLDYPKEIGDKHE